MKEYNTLPKIDHNYVVSRVIEPSCTQEGFTQYACTMCKQSYNTDYTEATGHSYEITRVVKEATCTEEGYIELRCSKCRDFKHENTPKAEHKYTDKVVPPSSKEKGYTLHTCTVCRYSYKDNYTEDYDPHPAKLYKMDKGYIKEGGADDIVIYAPDEKWVVSENFASKAANSPFIGDELYGKIKYTICNGNVVYSDANKKVAE